jgi:cytochrome c oxidase subunit III
MAAVPAATVRAQARVSPLAVGVVVWLASELMFFAGLFAAYYTLRSSNTVWPPPGVELDVPRALVLTVVLLASSGTMHLAVKAADAGERRQSLRWLAVTFLLGTAFLVNLGLEWAGNDFTLSSNAYGSIYYLLTGFHGLHVLGGLALMIAAAVAVTGTDSKMPLGPTFTVTAYYWHFVDVVWLAVFATIFLVQ